MIRAGRAFKFVVLFVSATVAQGCASNTKQAPVTSESSVASAPSQRLGAMSMAERAAAVALQQVGVPYRYGGKSPTGFDCSGLVHYSFAKAGASVPRTTSQLWSATRSVDERQLREGDLLFFRFDGKIAHVGMYLGNDRFVHAPSSGKQVSVQSLRSQIYRDAFVRAGRL